MLPIEIKKLIESYSLDTIDSLIKQEKLLDKQIKLSSLKLIHIRNKINNFCKHERVIDEYYNDYDRTSHSYICIKCNAIGNISWKNRVVHTRRWC